MPSRVNDQGSSTGPVGPSVWPCLMRLGASGGPVGSLLVAPEPMGASDPADMPEQAPAVVHATQKMVTAAIVAGPAVALAIVIPWLWGHAVNLSDIVIGIVFYVVTGFGLTIGFHRLFTHSGFRPRRVLKITLAVLGSMAVEGSVTSWVATHRRHHMFSDHSGDPHSPHRYGGHDAALLWGLAFSHVGWLFISDASSAERYAPDMLRDRDLQRIGIRCVLDPGDEALVLTPAWPNGASNVAMFNATAVEIAHPLVGDRYQIDSGALEAAVTPRTRLLQIGR